MPLTDVETAAFTAKPLELPKSRVERAIRARHGLKDKHAESGHCLGYTSDSSSGRVHVLGSIVSQLSAGLPIEDGILDDFVRYGKVAGRARRNILFVVDTSGSMVSSGKLALVKGCVVSLLQDAYVNRTRVAIIGFGGMRAHVILPFTTSAEMAANRIDATKGGGATPLLEALELAMPLVDSVDGEPAEVVLMSDGGFNRRHDVSANDAIDTFGKFCARRTVPIHFIYSGAGNRTSERKAKRLAEMLHADYRTIADMNAETLLEGDLA